MDSNPLLTCAICFDIVDPQDGFIYGRSIPLVKGKNVCVHHVCLCIRKCMPRRRMAKVPECPPGISIPWPQVARITKDNKTCSVCHDDVTETSPFSTFPGCTHEFAHLRCLDVITDTTRRWTCPLCQLNNARDDMILSKWCQPRVGKFAQVFMEDEDEPEPSEEIQQLCDSTSIIQSIEQMQPALAIKRSFEKRKTAENKKIRIDTLPKWIVHAMKIDAQNDKSKRMSVLEKLHVCEYTAKDLLTFGFTFEMLVADVGNHGLLLDRTFAVTAYVSRPPMFVTFTKMLLAGIDIGIIATAGYTEMDLNHLRFTMRGFIAAGGTSEELRALRAKIKDTSLCNTFSFTTFMEECLGSDNRVSSLKY